MNLKRKLKEKQSKIAAERRQRDLEELNECTFKPKTNPGVMDNNEGVVVVRGLGRHLELQELKKKQAEEKMLREAEVFGVNHKFAVNADQYDVNNPDRYKMLTSQLSQSASSDAVGPNGAFQTTVPKPFNLSMNQQFGQIRRQRVHAEIKEKQMNECTVKPATNESRQREIIN